MAKRNYGWTEEKIDKYYRDGRGAGELSNYKPWLTVHDVPSKGNSTRIKGWKTGRIHQFFSNIERNYFYILEWSDSVLDIREQFPLDRVDTIEIAKKKGLNHIEDRTTKVLIPMTTDFVVTIKRNGKIETLAVAIKPADQLEYKNVLNKLEVERAYWNNKNVSWEIITQKDIPKHKVKNIELLHPYRSLEQKADNKENLLLEELIDSKTNTRPIRLFNLLNSFDRSNALDSGSALNYFKYLLANKIISIDLSEKINPRNLNIQDISIDSQIMGSDYNYVSSK
ncbi:TnsA endonuclease C terminal [Amphibacillus marinus]|uniref:TnsA endonuclease C terminal n=1 Tax=Amphibacillus marinus TaxID=872970 RepID=A0A1H8TJ21_9BACI|nr:TnsA endonuclease N-terminal domain-containing protein [Amphibacillus marinus]SEO90508.1 TnsA endonuclease C terminal [Amphibacillus marinus]